MMELEQVVHRPQRDVVDFLEIERHVDLGGHALQNLELRRLARERCRRVRLGHGSRLVSSSRSSSGFSSLLVGSLLDR